MYNKVDLCLNYGEISRQSWVILGKKKEKKIEILQFLTHWDQAYTIVFMNVLGLLDRKFAEDHKYES